MRRLLITLIILAPLAMGSYYAAPLYFMITHEPTEETVKRYDRYLGGQATEYGWKLRWGKHAGKKDGPYAIKFPNGFLSEIGEFRHDKQTGHVQLWHKNGQLHRETEYLDGAKHGMERTWDASGKIQSERSFKNNRIVR